MNVTVTAMTVTPIAGMALCCYKYHVGFKSCRGQAAVTGRDHLIRHSLEEALDWRKLEWTTAAAPFQVVRAKPSTFPIQMLH